MLKRHRYQRSNGCEDRAVDRLSSRGRRARPTWGLLAVVVVLMAAVTGCSQTGGDDVRAGAPETTATSQPPSSSTSSTTTSKRSTTTSTTRPRPTTTTTTRPPAPPPSTTVAEGMVEIESFVSPTRNIGCMVIVDSATAEARCDIRAATFQVPTRPADCDLEWGPALAVSDGPGRFACVGDTVFDPDASTLPYGSSMTVGPFVCTSEETGVTCTNTATGHGFSVRRAAYRLF